MSDWQDYAEVPECFLDAGVRYRYQKLNDASWVETDSRNQAEAQHRNGLHVEMRWWETAEWQRAVSDLSRKLQAEKVKTWRAAAMDREEKKEVFEENTALRDEAHRQQAASSDLRRRLQDLEMANAKLKDALDAQRSLESVVDDFQKSLNEHIGSRDGLK